MNTCTAARGPPGETAFQERKPAVPKVRGGPHLVQRKPQPPGNLTLPPENQSKLTEALERWMEAEKILPVFLLPTTPHLDVRKNEPQWVAQGTFPVADAGEEESMFLAIWQHQKSDLFKALPSTVFFPGPPPGPGQEEGPFP